MWGSDLSLQKIHIYLVKRRHGNVSEVYPDLQNKANLLLFSVEEQKLQSGFEPVAPGTGSIIKSDLNLPKPGA